MRTGALASFFVTLNALYAATTAYLMSRGACEANPFMAAVLSFGVLSFLVFKVSAALLLAAILARFTLWSLKAVCVAFVGIVAWQATLCLTM